jgi:hypothetical protein
MTTGEYNMARIWLKKISLALLVLTGGLSIFYGAICVSIFTEVHEVCQYALKQFKGKELLTATVMLLESDEVDFTVKNRAVYALGQIGDKAALIALKNLKSQSVCRKPCTKDGYICQYELEKAIRTCEGGQFSATKWMYRFL